MYNTVYILYSKALYGQEYRYFLIGYNNDGFIISYSEADLRIVTSFGQTIFRGDNKL